MAVCSLMFTDGSLGVPRNVWFFLSMMTTVDHGACILHAQNALKHFEGSLIPVLKRSTAEGEKHKPCLVLSVSFWAN